MNLSSEGCVNEADKADQAYQGDRDDDGENEDGGDCFALLQADRPRAFRLPRVLSAIAIRLDSIVDS
jgi:hypothetical protein